MKSQVKSEAFHNWIKAKIDLPTPPPPPQLPIGSLGKDVFKRRRSTGSEFFSFLVNVFTKIFGQMSV